MLNQILPPGRKELVPHPVCFAVLHWYCLEKTMLFSLAQKLGSGGSWPGSRLAARFMSVIQSTERAANELSERLSK